jgi:hypothetical protein
MARCPHNLRHVVDNASIILKSCQQQFSRMVIFAGGDR